MATLAHAEKVSAGLAVRRFGLHFLEMCVVMCLGGVLLDIVVFTAVSWIAGVDFVARSTEVSILIVGVDAAIAMAAYMFVRGHPLRHNVEMSASAVVGAIVFVVALRLGWLPAASFATVPGILLSICGPICLLMFVVMAARFEHYGGRVAVTRVVSSNGDWTCSMHPEVLMSAPGRCPVCDMKLVPLRRRGGAPA